MSGKASDLREELMNSASEDAIALALFKQEVIKAAKQAMLEKIAPPFSTSVSNSMNMMGDVFYAHFLSHYVTFTPEDMTDGPFTCQLEESHETGKCAIRIGLKAATPNGIRDINRDAELKTARLELDHFAEYLDDVRFRSSHDNLTITADYNADDQYTVSLEAPKKRDLFKMLQLLQQVHPQFYAGPLDVFDTIDFGTTSKDKADRWDKVYELAAEFCANFNDAANADGVTEPVWLNAIAGIPITSDKMGAVAAYLGSESISPYSLADIEVTLCREEGRTPPYHLRHTSAALGIN